MHVFRAALFASALIAPAALLARPMTPEDVARLEQVGALAISPDGSRVAYTRAWRHDVTQGEANGAGRQQLFLADGPMEAREWLPRDMSVSQVSFSPDGRWVSFLWTKSGEKAAVWGVPVAGGAQRKLAAVDDAGVTTYRWAPDGGTIYMIAGAEPDAARKKESDAGFTAVIYEEELQFNRLFAARMGAEADAEPRLIEVPGHVTTLRISPDGEWAAVSSAPTPLVDDSYTANRVHIVDLERGRVARVVETPGKLGDVEISPTGRALSMIAAVDKNDPADTTLHLVDVETGRFRALNGGAAEAAVDAEWLADGRLAAVVHVGAQSVLRFYTEDGNVEREVDPGELILSRVESGGNRVIVTADSPRHPAELFLWGGAGFTRWTDHNEWLAEIDFGEQRTLTYTARDGQEIEGILIEPAGRIPASGAPTIMMVHGGPEAHYSNGWLTAYSQPGQVGAGQGYAVFHPNYRGSTAYGVDFAKQHQGDYAGKEFDDIVDAKYALAELGVTDPARVGITGGSYGGFASAWGATRYSQEYAASVMFVGISNNISKFGTTDIPNEMYLAHELKWPWEEWDRLLERSPIYHVDKAETPLLILHGDADPRVSPMQSLELYRHIKVRKPETPVRLVWYPGEGHGNAQSAARYDYNLRMMEWFDTYLKSGDRDAAMPAPRPTLPDAVTGDETAD